MRPQTTINALRGPAGARLEIELVPLRDLKPSPRNARTHSLAQKRKIADSIRRFGFNNPIILNQEGQIIAGHARAEAAKLLGMSHVPSIRLPHLNATEVRAFTLADNRLAEKAGWDREILAAELQELQIALPEIGLDLEITGFEPGVVDTLMLDFAEGRIDSEDELPEIDGKRTVARTGDLFNLGKHRLLVADARHPAAYERLLSGETAQMAFLDPPYNVRIDGHVGGRGRVKHREFACASGEMTSEQFVSFLQETLGLCARYTVDGGISFICMDWRHISELSAAGGAVYDELKNVCIWDKTTPGQGSFYRNQYELVFVFKKGKRPHLNTFGLGQHGRSRSNIWRYAGANMFRAGRLDDLKMHPTVKPVGLIVDAMRDCSRRNDIVLDVFAGSGSTIAAADQIGRRARCLEIDPRYVDVAVRRWQRITRKDATLEPSGKKFDELEIVRAKTEGSERIKSGHRGR